MNIKKIFLVKPKKKSCQNLNHILYVGWWVDPQHFPMGGWYKSHVVQRYVWFSCFHMLACVSLSIMQFQFVSLKVCKRRVVYLCVFVVVVVDISCWQWFPRNVCNLRVSKHCSSFTRSVWLSKLQIDFRMQWSTTKVKLDVNINELFVCVKSRHSTINLCSESAVFGHNHYVDGTSFVEWYFNEHTRLMCNSGHLHFGITANKARRSVNV